VQQSLCSYKLDDIRHLINTYFGCLVIDELDSHCLVHLLRIHSLAMIYSLVLDKIR
jgi:hypothetical protein